MRKARVALAATSALLVACEIPTEAPVIEQRWIIPVEETTLPVDELLPDGVVNENGSFRIDVDPTSASRTLGELCGVGCSALMDGATVVVPPFTGGITTTRDLPLDVTGGTITDGQISLSIQNGLPFDIIGATGTLDLTVSVPGGDQLAQFSLMGPGDQFPPGSTITPVLDVDPAEIGSQIELSWNLTSPGSGGPVTFQSSDQVGVDMTSAFLLVSSVTIDVGTRDVEFDSVELDVEDFDETLTDRILEGTVILDVANPFDVSVGGTLDIGPTSKSISISPDGTSTQTLSYTAAELRSFLGQGGIVLSGEGTATGGTITVTPDQRIDVDGTLDLTVELP